MWKWMPFMSIWIIYLIVNRPLFFIRKLFYWKFMRFLSVRFLWLAGDIYFFFSLWEGWRKVVGWEMSNLSLVDRWVLGVLKGFSHSLCNTSEDWGIHWKILLMWKYFVVLGDSRFSTLCISLISMKNDSKFRNFTQILVRKFIKILRFLTATSFHSELPKSALFPKKIRLKEKRQKI